MTADTLLPQALLALRWYVVVQAFGLAALPLCLRLFRHLPDRGYGMSKPLGLLLAGWTFWLLTTLGWLHNTVGGILVALGLLLALGLVVKAQIPNPKSQSPNSKPASCLLPPASSILLSELVFALAFVAWCLVRAHMPRIQTAGGEKWMEIAFLRAILRADTFPPHDPWLSGFAISYYHFGYIIVAMLTRLAAVPPSIAFNLGIATLFALTCAGASTLAYNLGYVTNGPPLGPPASCRHDDHDLTTDGPPTGPPASYRHANRAVAFGGAVLAPLLVAVMGNLEGLLEVFHAAGVGSAGFWAWLDITRLDQPPVPFGQGTWVPTRFFWWWQASRVLQDYGPWGGEQHVIDEFPGFSFILGDMHPHVLALPFVLLALALALNLYLAALKRPGSSQATKPGFLRETWFLSPWEFLVYALCLGGLGFLNTWDFPIYLFVLVAAYALAALRTSYLTFDTSRLTFGVSRFTFAVSRLTFDVLHLAFLFLSLLIAGILLYFPFWASFQSQAGGILINVFSATRLPQFLVMFGPLAFIAVAFVAGEARRSGVRMARVLRWTLAVLVGILVLLALVLALFALLASLGAIQPQGPASYAVAWIRGEPLPGVEEPATAGDVLLRNLLARVLNPWTALVLIGLIATVALTLREKETRFSGKNPVSESSDFVLLLLATGGLLALGVEYVYLSDHFGTRMNTVFKFYFQTWVLWAIAAAYALATFARRGRVGVVAVAGLLILAGFVYPLLAIPARAGEYGGPPTLDATAYLAQAQPEDYAAIAWLNENVGRDGDVVPVILEAPGDQFKAYVYEGRVSAHTGLPTLLGWGGHEHQWRGDYEEQARREPDIEALYTSVDPDEVWALLDEYDIRYVYVGPLERGRYPPAGLAKFAGLLDVAYDADGVTIYRVEEVRSPESEVRLPRYEVK